MPRQNRGKDAEFGDRPSAGNHECGHLRLRRLHGPLRRREFHRWIPRSDECGEDLGRPVLQQSSME